jgi:hypothetical protein
VDTISIVDETYKMNNLKSLRLRSMERNIWRRYLKIKYFGVMMEWYYKDMSGLADALTNMYDENYSYHVNIEKMILQTG